MCTSDFVVDATWWLRQSYHNLVLYQKHSGKGSSCATMVLKILGAVANSFLPSSYYVHAFVSVIAIVVVHAFAQGRTTNRERDMHARVVLVTVSRSFTFPPVRSLSYSVLRAVSPHSG